MTNGDKFLRDGVSVEEVAKEFEVFCTILKEIYSVMTYKQEMEQFLNCEIKPTLTEDERVILRNMQKGWKYIGRYEYDDTWAFSEMLYISTAETKKSKFEAARLELSQFNHLFQFIKERRRIFNTRIIRR